MEPPRPFNDSLCRSPDAAAASASSSAWNGTGAAAAAAGGGLGGCDPSRRGPRGLRDLDVSVRVLLYAAIFLLSLVGNALIVVVLVLNRRMRTVTNSFLLSLALSDLMVALFCMPFTFIPNIMHTFVFGKVICKAVAYLMGMSVSVSTFSLVAIAIERYNAICNPLQSRVWQTRSHAYRVIAATWLLSALLMLPYPVYSAISSPPGHPTIFQCSPHWPGRHVRQAWYVLLLVTLFLVPGLVMTVAYGLISRELYRGIQFEMDLTRKATAHQNGGTEPHAAVEVEEGDGCYVQGPLPGTAGAPPVELSVLTPAMPDRARVNSSEAKLLAKKRVIRMLVVIVAVFFACWLPVYGANTWRAFDAESAHRALAGTPISFIHLLSYASAGINPFVYCFMNKRFRKAFATTFARCCCCCGPRGPCPFVSVALRRRRQQRGPCEEELTTASGPSLSKISYTTVSSAGPL